MNTRELMQGIAAFVLAALPVVGVGCVGQTDSGVDEADESIGAAEQAVTVCPPPTLVSTELFDDACASTQLLRRLQYGADGIPPLSLSESAPTVIGTICRDYCAQSVDACGVGWRLDSANDDPVVELYFPGNASLDTDDLGILQRRTLTLGQSISGTQEVTCLQRRDVNDEGDDAHQWVAICTCPDVP